MSPTPATPLAPPHQVYASHAASRRTVVTIQQHNARFLLIYPSERASRAPMNTATVSLFNLKHLTIGLAMLLAAGLAVALTPKTKIADQGPRIDLEAMIPKQFGDWQVDESIAPVVPSPDVQANLDMIYDQIVSRTYVDKNGRRIMLSITYGSTQNQQLRAHRQEVCYSAQGFDIHDLEHTTINVDGAMVPATRMFAIQGPRKEPVTYWFTMGDTVVLSRLDRQLVQLKYALSGLVPDGYLVRISNISDRPIEAYQEHLRFAEELFRSLDPVLKRKLLGRPQSQT